MIYGFINSYRFQIDIYIKVMLFSKDSGELFLRFHRVEDTCSDLNSNTVYVYVLKLQLLLAICITKCFMYNVSL